MLCIRFNECEMLKLFFFSLVYIKCIKFSFLSPFFSVCVERKENKGSYVRVRAKIFEAVLFVVIIYVLCTVGNEKLLCT